MAEFDRLTVKPGIAPMEAKLVDELPPGSDWQYEPKWDGFRCIAHRDGVSVELRSKSGKTLTRYFPEVREMLAAIAPTRFVIDGELIIPIGDALSFEALQMRLHPAESRVRRLAAETPAQFMLFDCLELGADPLIDQPLSARRDALEAFHRDAASADLLLSPCTLDLEVAIRWLEASGGALDGVVAKRRSQPYRTGERAMLKVKQQRTADCVVGGFRYASGSDEIGSLLLGLYDKDGLLHHVGFTSAIAEPERARLKPLLEARIEPPGFTGRAPGGPSRWSTERTGEWQPLGPDLVVEIRYDQVTGDRFRHGTGLLRWRPDKAPEQCTIDQLQHELRPAELLEVQ